MTLNNITATIKSNRQIASGIYEMVLDMTGSQDICRSILPGQFINIRLDGFYLRRPISICDWNDTEITIIYKTAGRGTGEMSTYMQGRCLDILLPLGNGYDISRAGKRPIVLGGGVGVPPMYGLCRELVAAGSDPIAVIGFNSSEEVFYEEEFRKLGIDLIVTTADGSHGVRGFVTDEMANRSYTSFFACGPEPMLKAVCASAPQDIPGWLSFEERMGCGFGACMGCSCKTLYGNKRICKDGPVLERKEIIW